MQLIPAGLRNALNEMPRPAKRIILVLFDIAALSACVWLAYCLRLGRIYIPTPTQIALILAAPIVAFPIFVRMGLYRSIIRFLPERAIWSILQATTIATLLWVAVLFLTEMSGIEGAPRAVPVLYWGLATFAVAGSRFAAKYLLWMPMRRNYSRQVLIYGAGAEGARLADALLREGTTYVAGFIDEKKALQDQDLAGVRVYSPDRLPELIALFGAKEIILSISAMDPVRRREIVTGLSAHQLKIRTLPPIADLASGRYLISQLREIDIDDILGRSSVPADPELIAELLEDKTILVTGAGGSIGSELCRLIAKSGPKKLILFEANEFALYELDRQLSGIVKSPLVAVLGSVVNQTLVRQTLETHQVDVVFHAAAHKHVPLLEANALEGMRNNVFGTKTLADAALSAGVERFILISTDKAVRPANVMGATKRWAELIIRDCAERAAAMGTNQHFSAVRFGNVLGSNGSVVPLFREQIAGGGPVTLTSNEMTRYFMSIHEAAELIVQAGALCEGGDVFLLDMGVPIRIRELAENMVRLSGLSLRGPENPDGDIEIAVVGSRRGEKMHEELLYNPDSARPTRHPKILRAESETYSARDLTEAINALRSALDENDEPAARAILFELISGVKDRAQPAPGNLKLAN